MLEESKRKENAKRWLDRSSEPEPLKKRPKTGMVELQSPEQQDVNGSQVA
jgi:hypothetical protein